MCLASFAICCQFCVVFIYSFRLSPVLITFSFVDVFLRSDNFQTLSMCAQYNAKNRRKYFPKPPAVPHPNSIKTPDDYPEEQERLAILAEKKRIREEMKAKALAAKGMLKLVLRSLGSEG